MKEKMQDNQQPKLKKPRHQRKSDIKGILIGEIYGNYKVLRKIKKPKKVSRGNGVYVECMATCWECEYIPTGEIRIITTGHLSEYKTGEQIQKDMDSLVHSNKHQLGFRNYLFRSSQNGAKARNHEYDLTQDQFESLITQNCYYCGAPPRPASESAIKDRGNPRQPTFYYNGIDRINSELGYTIENCVPCCPTCNYMKRTLQQDDFYKQIIKIYQNLNLGSTTIENTDNSGSEQSTPQANGGGNSVPLTDNAEGEDIV